MDIHDLQYFLAIAEEGSISAAAKRLHMAQPPLSRHIKQLEEQLGVQLMERGKRRIKLTAAGQLLRIRAEQVTDLLNTTTKELLDFDSGVRGVLSIGAVTASGATLLPNIIKIFHDRYPNVTFRIREGETSRIIELLDTGIVDLGMVRLPFDTNIYDSIHLPNEPLVIVYSPEFPGMPATSSPTVRLEELKNKPLMIHRKFETLLTGHCQQAGFSPLILCESDDVMPLLTWADASIGIAVVPRSAIGLIPRTQLIAREIIDPPLDTTAAIIWVRKRYMPATALHFLNLFVAETAGGSKYV